MFNGSAQAVIACLDRSCSPHEFTYLFSVFVPRVVQKIYRFIRAQITQAKVKRIAAAKAIIQFSIVKLFASYITPAKLFVKLSHSPMMIDRLAMIMPLGRMDMVSNTLLFKADDQFFLRIHAAWILTEINDRVLLTHNLI